MRREFLVWLFALSVVGAATRLAAGSSPQFVTLYHFGGVNAIPSSPLTLGPSGQLFGTTYGNAASDGSGSIYELAPNGAGGFTFISLYRFDTSGSPPNDGQYPYAGLTLSPDGTTLYGTTEYGGPTGGGTLFTLNFIQAGGNVLEKPRLPPSNGDGYGTDPDPDVFTVSTGGGARSVLFGKPDELVTAALYLFGNVSTGGGPTDSGFTYVIAELTSPNSISTNRIIITFDGINGATPQGKLAVGPAAGSSGSARPSTGKSHLDLSTVALYGTTVSGGSNNWGTVFTSTADGSNFLTLHHFSFSTTNGASPLGGMVLAGNTLYGTTSGGGSNYAGTVFSINTDGSAFTIIKNLDYATTGYTPQGDLILSGDTLYGTTYAGGVNGGGTVFSIRTNGTHFTVLHSFMTPTADGQGNFTNSDGGWSVAGLVLTNNTLFGATPHGGTNGVGTAYEILLPSPPTVSIERAGGGLAVSWPSGSSNFWLQSNSSLSSLTWSNFGGLVNDDGTNKSIALPSPLGTTYYRLISTNGL